MDPYQYTYDVDRDEETAKKIIHLPPTSLHFSPMVSWKPRLNYSLLSSRKISSHEQENSGLSTSFRSGKFVRCLKGSLPLCSRDPRFLQIPTTNYGIDWIFKIFHHIPLEGLVNFRYCNTSFQEDRNDKTRWRTSKLLVEVRLQDSLNKFQDVTS
ncbi:hypothetical protein ARMGADRAFT_1039618 [Armillaria gallica]|uniref:Uncharacterized protein n=1 Tax=Armillaria gallica TaxID=47427 RepID=A0A2H3D0H9_ARMGA|nr:hypothetical protein ARMGADRAFT_1039618 [Armillaria gallica]